MVRQARTRAVAVDLLAHLFEVAKEGGGVLDVPVLVRVTRHAALALQVLALERTLYLAAQDIVALTQPGGLCADFGAHARVERGLAGGRDVGGECGVGELAGELG